MISLYKLLSFIVILFLFKILYNLIYTIGLLLRFKHLNKYYYSFIDLENKKKKQYFIAY